MMPDPFSSLDLNRRAVSRSIVKKEIIVAFLLGKHSIIFMPRRSNAADMLPPPVERALITLGEHLYIARKRRKQTLSSFADRMQVSVPTLRKMERGDPTVSISVYAMAL